MSLKTFSFLQLYSSAARRADGDCAEPRVQEEDQRGGEHRERGEKVRRGRHERLRQIAKVRGA